MVAQWRRVGRLRLCTLGFSRHLHARAALHRLDSEHNCRELNRWRCVHNRRRCVNNSAASEADQCSVRSGSKCRDHLFRHSKQFVLASKPTVKTLTADWKTRVFLRVGIVYFLRPRSRKTGHVAVNVSWSAYIIFSLNKTDWDKKNDVFV